ncbi:MAG TPA: hypothetical protein VLL76_04940 [Candidatus Omnitrophota bacterium]|nr:hypothetical protein [Candidatus Omnitrophota bacterium]
MKPFLMLALLLACALPARAEQAVEGIEIESLRLTAAGNMVDLRLKVTDAEKAARVLDGANQPMLKVKGAGKTLVVPAPAKIGPLKATGGKLEAGRTYFVLFGNPKRLLTGGQQVDLRFGPYLIPDLVVEN